MNFLRQLSLTTLCSLALSASGNDQPYLVPAQHIAPPLPRQSVTNRAFTGISSMAVAPNGRLWATWYAGPTPGEDKNNYVVLSTSGDGGKNWKELLVVDPDGEGPWRSYDPEVWVDPSGRLWLFWAQARNHGEDAHLWALVAKDAGSGSPQWEAPRMLAPGVMMCKPLVLRNGAWVFPISDWKGRLSQAPDAATAGFWISKDQGGTITRKGGALVPVKDRTFDEHMFIERRDGSLWTLIRTRYGIGESISTDGGASWPEAKPSSIPHPAARFFISPLNSGNILLVKHGPIAEKTGRSHLTAFISKDDGKTWEGGLLIDERSGVSYPDGQQTADGTIYITYDYSRTADRNIFFATFREEDVLTGKDVSGKVRMRQVISKGSGGMAKKDTGEPKPVKDNADGVALDRQSPGTWKCEISQAFKTGSKLFSDRNYTLSEVPSALSDAKFALIAMDGRKTLTCDNTGMLYMLTPEPERNKDSASQTLLEQGFKKVALPEVRLFDRKNPGNYCTLFQKDCKAGETVTIGKWGVPLFLEK